MCLRGGLPVRHQASQPNLFLIGKADGEAAVDTVTGLIHSRWDRLRRGSPNLTATDPVAWIYASSTETAADVLALSEVLLAAGMDLLGPEQVA